MGYVNYRVHPTGASKDSQIQYKRAQGDGLVCSVDCIQWGMGEESTPSGRGAPVLLVEHHSRSEL